MENWPKYVEPGLIWQIKSNTIHWSQNIYKTSILLICSEYDLNLIDKKDQIQVIGDKYLIYLSFRIWWESLIVSHSKNNVFWIFSICIINHVFHFFSTIYIFFGYFQKKYFIFKKRWTLTKIFTKWSQNI
jgi:hypothetical protein